MRRFFLLPILLILLLSVKGQNTVIHQLNYIYNLQHGIMEWNLQNLPVVVEPNARPDSENKMEMDEFTALVKSGSSVFVDFYAPWCAPCRKMIPMINSLKTEFAGRINIVEINADASKKLIWELQIGSVPHMVLFHKGKKAFSHDGLKTKKELIALFYKTL